MQSVWIVFILLIGVGYVVAFTRKGKVTGASMTSRQHTVFHTAPPAVVFAAIKNIGRPFVVDDADGSSNIIVLSSPVTFFSWGFLYPVFITQAANGGSQILVGCGSKLIQMGPIVTNAHNKCVAAIEAALSAAPARVVNG
jgi:hypothetical protein